MRHPLRVLGVAALLLPVHSSLYGDLRDKLVDHINKAHTSIDLVVYEIRSNDISDALIDAHRRAVRVRIIVDSVHSPVATPQEKTLEDEGIEIKRIGGISRDLMHDKFILFDDSVASTPSYNRSSKSLTRGDEGNAFTSDSALIARLKQQFNTVWTHAQRDAEPENAP